MSKMINRKYLVPLAAFILLDLLAVGAGMGVPFFPILFGFIVGWLAPSIVANPSTTLQYLLRKCVLVACLTSSFTFLLMLLIWSKTALMLLDPSADLANWGIPMILYEPRASFVGWVILMVLISPFLQLLTTAVASSVRLAWFPPSLLRKETTQ